MSREIKLRFTFPHPGDQYLVLCLSTLRGEWVVSTLNLTSDGHCCGHYFNDDEAAATRFFWDRVAQMCEQRAREARLALDEPEAYSFWSAPPYYKDGLPPSLKN